MGSTKFDDNNDRIRQKRYTCKLSKLNIIQDEGGGGGGAKKSVWTPIVQYCRACRENYESAFKIKISIPRSESS